MRVLKFNGELVQIDDKTSIGIDLQAYDFKDPGKSKTSVSNGFSVPATTYNLKLIGFANNPAADINSIYEKIKVDYFVDNEIYIEQGTARIKSITKGRINLYVSQRPEFIDEMKSKWFYDFLSDYLTWYNNTQAGNYTTLTEIVNALNGTTNHIHLPVVVSNLFDLDEAGTTPEILGEMVLKTGIDPVYYGGHLSTYIIDLFKDIERQFNINLHSDYNRPGNLFFDAEFITKHLFTPEITINDPGNFVLEMAPEKWADEIVPHKDLTVYDFFNATLKLFGAGLQPFVDSEYEDPLTYNMNNSFALFRFDDMDKIDFSGQANFAYTGNLPGVMAQDWQFNSSFAPEITGFEQNTYIKMKPYGDGSEFLGAKKIVSNNKNLEQASTAFEINAYVAAVFTYSGNQFLDLTKSEAFEAFVFMETDFTKDIGYSVRFGTETKSFPNMHTAQIYTVSNEYNIFEQILTNPAVWKIDRWVRPSELRGFISMAPYYVRELGGWFFVNKVKGWNPDKSLKPVEFELIKLPFLRDPNLDSVRDPANLEWILETGYWNDNGVWIDTSVWQDG